MTQKGTSNEEKERERWETERVLERAEEFQVRSAQSLRERRRRLKRIRANLRRAGLLRD
jgi:hypothetical protein